MCSVTSVDCLIIIETRNASFLFEKALLSSQLKLGIQVIFQNRLDGS